MSRPWWFHWSTLAILFVFAVCLAGVLALFRADWMRREITLKDVERVMPFQKRAYVIFSSRGVDTLVSRTGPNQWDYDRGWFWFNGAEGPNYPYPSLVTSLEGDTLWSIERIRAEQDQKRRAEIAEASK